MLARLFRAIPWWGWLLVGVCLALVVDQPLVALLGVPGLLALQRRQATAARAHLDERADDLERRAERHRAEARAAAERHRAEDTAVEDAGRRAAERVPGASKWDRFWPLRLLVAASLVSASFGPSAAQPSQLEARDASAGEWIDGSRRECIPLERYEVATPVPAGCAALRPGVLLTVAEDDRRARLEATLLAEADELRRQLAAERARLAVVVPVAAEDLDDAAAELRGAGAQVGAVHPPSPWPDRLAGAAVGAAAVGLVWLVAAVAP